MRKQIAAFLLVGAVVVWGVWCGGQYFNEARVIPKLLANPPASVAAYNAIVPAGGELPFFFPLNPLIFLLSLGAAAAAWKAARASRKWLALATVIGFGVCLVLILYLAPLMWSIMQPVEITPAEEITRRAAVWKLGNRIRLLVEFAGFICSVIALRVWSAESGNAENLK
jgi:hypothetical protein